MLIGGELSELARMAAGRIGLSAEPVRGAPFVPDERLSLKRSVTTGSSSGCIPSSTVSSMRSMTGPQAGIGTSVGGIGLEPGRQEHAACRKRIGQAHLRGAMAPLSRAPHMPHQHGAQPQLDRSISLASRPVSESRSSQRIDRRMGAPAGSVRFEDRTPQHSVFVQSFA